jgi:hypothetical protein
MQWSSGYAPLPKVVAPLKRVEIGEAIHYFYAMVEVGLVIGFQDLQGPFCSLNLGLLYTTFDSNLL